MAAHGVARGLGFAGGDGIGDAAVLFLDEREVGAPAAHALGQAAHGAPRDQVAADELQEARELRVAGGFGDRAMEAEVLVDRGFAFPCHFLNGLKSSRDRAHVGFGRALGGESRRFDLHAEAQLHHVQDLVERLEALGLDAKRRARRLGRDEGAHTLARDHQPFGPQRRHRFAHHRARDARGARERVLGRQPGAGREAPAPDLSGELLEEPARQFVLRGEGSDAHRLTAATPAVV